MKNSNKLAILAFASALALTACSKKEDSNIMKYSNPSTIEGTIIGTSIDGQALDESFSFSKSDGKYSCYVYNVTLISSTGNTPGSHFTISALNEDGGSMKLEFFADGTSPVITESTVTGSARYTNTNTNTEYYSNNNTFDLTYIKNIKDNQILEYQVSSNYIKKETGTNKYVTNNAQITAFTYNTTSGKVTGSYYFLVTKVDRKNIKHDATIKGTFSATVYKAVN